VPEQRKVVTILFADVVGSTDRAARSDPEVVRALMARYFKRVAETAETHGGSVEKFAGDAAMVVFGVPAVHDDDAERAVRAALEIRDASAELTVRVGVNTGEAVTAATDDRQFMVSGDAVNVAARLQQGAEPGEVVVGALTEQLTRAVIEYEPREPVIAKGKAEPITAFKAIRPRSQVPVQARGVAGLRSPLVGRRRELRLLLDTFARTSEDRRLHLFTLIGAAGVGKSRLISEALLALSDSGARVLRGRCLPYGRGVTYWPFVEMLGQDTGITLGDAREAALAKLDRWLGELLPSDSERPAIKARLAAMMGFATAADVMPDTPAERVDREIAWGMRRYFEATAREAPLIVVVDDVQWAEPPVIKLLEQLAERAGESPILLVGIGRPEFLESHQGWGSGRGNSTTITLDPLSQEETGTLISGLLEIDALPSNLRTQIIERSAGTPLFCEEFISMLIDDGRLVREGVSWRAVGPVEQIRVPQSIQGVLAARLDGLPESERAVLQAASVIGERFQLDQVQQLLDGPDAETALESLRRKGLVTGGDGPRDDIHFRHLLIRDSAYGSLPKSERVTFHERFGAVLEAEAGDPTQVTEILAHHAERAFALSTELAMEGEPLLARARRALEWSLAMGDRAMTRRDVPTVDAALQTVGAAASVLPDGGGLAAQARMSLLQGQRLEVSADYQGAGRAVAEAARLAEQAGLPQLAATARLTEAWIMNWSGDNSHPDFNATVARAVDACRKAGDNAGEIEALHVGTYYLWGVGRVAEYVQANEELLDRARSTGYPAIAARILVRLALTEGVRGNTLAVQRHRLEAEALAARFGFRNITLQTLMSRGSALRLARDLPAAEDMYLQYLNAAEEAGAVQHQISALRNLAYALVSAGKFDEAAAALDRALLLSEATGETWNRSELLCSRARAALELNQLEAAESFIQRALSSLRHEDVSATSEVHHQLGLIRAAQGRDTEAEAALRRSLGAVVDTEYEMLRTESALALAAFLADRGRDGEAVALVEERKEIMETADWHLWDPEIDHIRSTVAAHRKS
jgi:class 3 adenylate cyclase/tetratricopeptide (TPR) repeat protein